MRAVRYHPEARAEFLHDVECYAAISTRLAELYDKAVHAAEMQAAATPEASPEYRKKRAASLIGGSTPRRNTASSLCRRTQPLAADVLDRKAEG